MCSTKSTSFRRLSRNVTPQKYVLDYDLIQLTPSATGESRFRGAEAIHLTIHAESTTTIICHAMELNLSNVIFTPEGQFSSSQKCTQLLFNLEQQTVAFHFNEPLPAHSRGVLSFTFEGVLNDNLHGFYRSAYTQSAIRSTTTTTMTMDQKQQYMAVTQYEACDARRAFVCWDEPDFKAVFHISMTTQAYAQLTALSNTPLQATHTLCDGKDGRGYQKKWQFEPTPVMSTYLVGMIVGEFDHVQQYTDNGVLVTVYTPLGASARGKFALRVATKALDFFTERYGIDYPLKKLDMLAIPDFAAGAMENWGLVTYRETRLLIDENASSLSQKLATARTVCHELAHQWFGNLVTMEWWTQLWLNEGFARFMEFEAVDHIFPQWKVWEQFVQEIVMASAMGMDGLRSSHPIEVEVNHPDEVDEIFDIISYAKGASLIRMISEFLGREVFYQGINHYLKKFQYGNAVTHDLWDSLEYISKVNIKAMCENWTKETGFPVVNVSIEDNNVALTQSRFYNDGNSQSDDKKVEWHIPLTAICGRNNETTTYNLGIWDPSSSNKEPYVNEKLSKLFATHDWVKLNALQSGFYLVNYEQPANYCLTKLKHPIESQLLTVVDRVSLLNGAFRLARAGSLPLAQVFEFSTFYANEPESYLIWRELSMNLRYYAGLINASSLCKEFYSTFQKYVFNVYNSHIMQKIGWEQENELETIGLLRKDVIDMLGNVAQDKDTIQKARTLYQSFLNSKDSKSISADLRSVVCSIAAANWDDCPSSGDVSKQQFDFYTQLRQKYMESDFIEVKMDCLRSLGKIPNQAVRSDMLIWATKSNGSNVRSQDISYAFLSVASDLNGAQLAWDFIKENWTSLTAAYPSHLLGRIIVSVVSKFSTFEKSVEVREFIAQQGDNSAYKRVLSNALERIETKARILERDEQCLLAWLKTL